MESENGRQWQPKKPACALCKQRDRSHLGPEAFERIDKKIRGFVRRAPELDRNEVRTVLEMQKRLKLAREGKACERCIEALDVWELPAF